MTAAGIFLAAGALVLSQDSADSAYLFLAGGYALLGLGFALINPPITSTAVAGMPAAQAGVASAVATSSRQLGSVLGVAIMGSVVTSRLHDHPGGAGPAGDIFGVAFTGASHAGWGLAAAAGLAIAVIAGLTTSPRARAVAARIMHEL